MWSLAWWWILFALPIPWLVRHFSNTEPTLKDAALKVPVPEEFAGLTGVSTKKTPPSIKLLVLWCIWILILFCLLLEISMFCIGFFTPNNWCAKYWLLFSEVYYEFTQESYGFRFTGS